MENKQVDLKVLTKRAVSGAMSLTARRVALQAISFITINLILAKILPVEILGIFNIATAIIFFFSYFSDVGLAAAIIQKKEDVLHDELKTSFTIQQILVSVIVIIILFLAPLFAKNYGLNQDGVWLIRALAVSFFITSLKVIPSVLLERELRFNPLITVEILETLTFNIVLILLSLNQYGLFAFSLAAILRSVVGASMIYLLAPWKIGFLISKEAAKKLLSFGLPFQINSFLALLKDRLVPLLIAKMIGAAGMGYVTWSQNLAFLPLEVLNIIIRVSFPAFSRLQGDKDILKKALEKSLFLTTLFLYPMLFGMVAMAPLLVEHIVSSKWSPALPAFYLFCVSTFLGTISTTITNFLNAIGKIKVTLYLMVFWTILTWILTPPLTLLYGFIGVAIASSIISLSSIITIFILKRLVNVEIIKNIWQPILASIIMGIVVSLLARAIVTNLVTLIITVLIGVVIYFGIISILAKDKMKIITDEARNVFFNN